MKRITIDGKEYTLEYTIGASLYDDCVVSIMRLLASATYSETIKGKEAVMEQLSVIGGIPKVALTTFYAGLLEHHGVGEYSGMDSDETVPDMKTARYLAQDYIREHKETGDGSFMDILNICIECMGEDDFLTLIGVDKAIEEINTPKTTTRKRQTKKATKATEK